MCLRCLLLGLYGVEIRLIWQEAHAFKPPLGSMCILLLGLYGSCSWVSIDPVLGSLWLLNDSHTEETYAFKHALGSPWLLLLGFYMTPALGSLLLLNGVETVRNARIQACFWVSMALAIGSVWLLLFGLYGSYMFLKLQEKHAFKLALGSPWLLLLRLYGS